MTVQSIVSVDAVPASTSELGDLQVLDGDADVVVDAPPHRERGSRQRSSAGDFADRSNVALMVKRAAAGDQNAWNALVERFASTVWAIARGHRLNSADAADVFQTTWLRLLEHLDRIEQPERVGAWLATTARRECFRLLRLAGRQVPSGDDFDVLPDPSTSRSPDRDIVALERKRLVNDLVDQLPVRSQLLLRLLSADTPLSYKEISEALSMPIGSIGPTRARALEQLRRLAVSEGLDLEEVFLA
jgi:RNA polymerase sigma factor (sigma-70 family)